VGSHAAMVYAGGRNQISYYDATNGALKYASGGAGGWTVSTVDSAGGDVGAYTGIAYDNFSRTHISYYDAVNGDLKVARTIPPTSGGGGGGGGGGGCFVDTAANNGGGGLFLKILKTGRHWLHSIGQP
jgi:hypothetical protein